MIFGLYWGYIGVILGVYNEVQKLLHQAGASQLKLLGRSLES